MRGRTGFENDPYPQADIFEGAFAAAQSVEVKPIVDAGFKGKDIKEQLALRRAEAVKAALATLR